MIDIEKVRKSAEMLITLNKDDLENYELREVGNDFLETINELERLQQKETPTIVKMVNNGFCIESRCHSCDNEVEGFIGQQYCSNCGQHLDWNDME